ncbi:MAG TPA: PorV/PorQ family protein [Gemmatimonadales bacterium]|jgi:hypothetical protein|nr:PorV/PorQ family protein [Gemmatimonadales bacterium]
MRRSRSRLAFVAASLGLSAPLAGQTTGEVTEGGAAFLLIAVGARATALGQAGIADARSADAAFWNPAGLALLPQSQVVVHHAATFASNNTVLSGYLASSLVGVVGLAAYLVDYGSQDIVPGPQQPPTGRITPRNIELVASYATSLSRSFTVGVNYKLIQLRNDCSGDCGAFRSIVGTTHGVDLGVQYGAEDPEGLRLGLALRHAGFNLQLENAGQADPLPTRLAAGADYRVALPQTPGAAPSFARLLMAVENPCCQSLTPDLRVGAELGYGDLIRLRGGYAFLRSESSGPSLGAGVQFDRLVVDFARVFFTSGNLDEPVYLTLRVLL